MYFKDRNYYIAKAQYYLVMAVSAIAFDALIVWLMCA